MARSTAYLETSRHNVFYFRIRVPLELTQSFPSAFIRRSLKTKCRREAIIRCSSILSQVCELFKLAECGKRVDASSLSWERLPEQPKNRQRVPSDPASVPSVKRSDKPKFSVVVKRYLQEQEMEKVSAKTIADKQSVCELMLRILGDKPIDQYSREDARRFKEVALQLPPRMGQLPKRSIDSMINEAEDTISPTTFNNYVKNLTTVFTHAVREEYCQKNPLEGLKINLRGKVSEQRARYSNEELKRLFEGIKSAKQDDRKPYREWLPLLGLYTGARLNELCQLYLDDIEMINGIHCFHIRALKSDQKLKNASSERIIPIHSKLIEAGFLEFVEQQRSLGAERLFPELSLHKRNGYGHIPSRWFAGVRDKLGLKGGEEKKDFHSFRHTVADHLKQLGVTESLVGALLGHSTGGVTFGRYGKDYEPEKLVVVVERLRFELYGNEKSTEKDCTLS